MFIGGKTRFLENRLCQIHPFQGESGYNQRIVMC